MKVAELDREVRYLVNKAKTYKPKVKSPNVNETTDNSTETSQNKTSEEKGDLLPFSIKFYLTFYIGEKKDDFAVPEKPEESEEKQKPKQKRKQETEEKTDETLQLDSNAGKINNYFYEISFSITSYCCFLVFRKDN